MFLLTYCWVVMAAQDITFKDMGGKMKTLRRREG